MKILIDGRWILQTGIGRYIYQTIEQILLLDKTNQYILLIRSEDKAKIKLKAPNLSLLPVDIQWYGFKEQTALLAVLNEQKPDLVHFTNFNFPLRYKGKFVITVHDLTLLHFKNIRKNIASKPIYMVKDNIMRLVLRQGINRARAIFAPSEYVKEDIASMYKIRRNKIYVVHEAATNPYQRARVDLVKMGINKPFLLYVGNAYPHKNLERLILAFGKLVTKYVLDYQLVIAGKKDDFHAALEEEVNKSGLEGRVLFTGYVNDSELAGLYKASSAYVFPSLSEGFGLPALEAMSYGTPVISSNSTCLPEILGDSAVYFDPKNIDNIAKVISQVMADKKLQDKMVKKGHLRVKKYNWKSTARVTLGVYEKILNQR